MANNNPAHIVTGSCRLSYCALTQPKRKSDKAEPRYSVTILVPKSDMATKQRIDMAVEAAAQAGTPTKWGGVRPPRVATPVYDGDGVRPSDGAAFGAECKGHWVFTASSKDAPGIVDANMQPILQATEIYSGMYGRVGVTFFAYAAEGKKGVGCSIDNVQKLADGEPLAGKGASAEEDFGGEAPAQGYQPAQPIQPAQPPAYQQQYAQPAQPPVYQPQPPTYQPPVYQQPTQPPQYGYQPQPTYQQAPAQPQYGLGQPAAQGYAPQQQPQIDPITGLPVGGVYGL